MKRFLFALCLLLVGSLGARAQETFLKYTSVVNVGLGFGSSLSTSTSFPALSASYDFSVASNLLSDDNGAIGIGALLSYVGSKNNVITPAFAGDFRENFLTLGARGTFHYQFVPKLDTYAGAMIGYNFVGSSSLRVSTPVLPGTVTSVEDLKHKSGLVGGVFVGARYYFTETIAAFGELGFSTSYLTLGASFAF